MMYSKAVILFSGGLDSTTCLAIAKAEGFACYALSFEYGQKNHIEIAHAEKTAGRMGVYEHKILPLPLGNIGGSACTDINLSVPDHSGDKDIPITYVPARNTIFL